MSHELPPTDWTNPRVAAVVLAAGASRRLGRPKQLLPLEGKPVIRWTVEHLTASGRVDVIVVVGHEAAAVTEALAGLPVRVVVNPSYRAGQSTSLRAGLEVVDASVDAVIFALADQPEVPASVVDALIDAYLRTGAPIVQPLYGGKPGNPVLFDRRLFPELARVTGDEGARSVIRDHQADVLRVAVPEQPPPGDIDTESDYRALLERWKHAPKRT